MPQDDRIEYVIVDGGDAAGGIYVRKDWLEAKLRESLGDLGPFLAPMIVEALEEKIERGGAK